MEYKKIQYNDLGAEVRLSFFSPEGGAGETHAMVTLNNPRGGNEAQIAALLETYGRLRGELDPALRPVFKRYFLSDASNQASHLPESDTCAVSVVEQPPLSGAKCAMWVLFQERVQVAHLRNGLFAVDHGGYRHFWQGSAACPGLHSGLATRALLGDLAINLENEGCNLVDNCVRTWFFVQNVDVNYKGVVDGRNEMFKVKGLTQDTHYIASTGIGGRHADHNVTVEMDSYSVHGLTNGQMAYLYASDYMNRTSDYGVAFERGTTVDYGDRRHVFISGTASINNRGEVAHPDNITAQTERMLTNVGALLEEAGTDFSDVAHAIVYLRDVSDYAAVKPILDERIPLIPRVIVLAPVCRPAWLIEMECMAVSKVTKPEYAPF